MRPPFPSFHRNNPFFLPSSTLLSPLASSRSSPLLSSLFPLSVLPSLLLSSSPPFFYYVPHPNVVPLLVSFYRLSVYFSRSFSAPCYRTRYIISCNVSLPNFLLRLIFTYVSFRPVDDSSAPSRTDLPTGSGHRVFRSGVLGCPFLPPLPPSFFF